MRRICFAILGLLAAAAAAQAQSARYPLKTLDFDNWCTEEQHWSYDRCDKRLPDDVKRFEAYRAIVEKYEIPYYQEKDQKLRFDRDIMHNDPIDNGVEDKANPPPLAGK
jgi:hypothetical protein